MQLPMSLHLQLVQALDFASLSERSSQQVCNVGCLAVSVLLARPEEPAQTVLTTPRHDVHMKMGDALADDVVVGHERAVSIERRRHHRRDRAHALEQRTDLFGLQFGKRHDVTPGHDQGVSGEQRRPVEERHGDIVTPHLVDVEPTVDHVTEHTPAHRCQPMTIALTITADNHSGQSPAPSTRDRTACGTTVGVVGIAHRPSQELLDELNRQRCP